MRKLGVIALAVLFVFPAATLAQIPTVGPGKCVSNCGGGGSGGGRRGGGGGMSGIGRAIGTGIAVGTILNAIQSAKPQGGDQGSQHSKEPARERHPQKPAKDEPVKEAKKPADTNTKGSNWSGCTGKVGTVWNAGNCGHPTSTSTSAGTGQRPRFNLIPYFVPIAIHQFVDQLPCPLGFHQVGETFYGGAKCAPGAAESNANSTVLADIAPEFTDPPSPCKPDKKDQPNVEFPNISDKTPVGPVELNCELKNTNCQRLNQLVSAIQDDEYKKFVKKLKFRPKEITRDATKLAPHISLAGPTEPGNKSDVSNEAMSSSGEDTINVGERYWKLSHNAQLVLLIFESGKNFYAVEETRTGKSPPAINTAPPDRIMSCLHSITADSVADPGSSYGLGALAKNFKK